MFVVSCSASSLENAERARALLGSDAWSRIIRVENTAKHSIYPHTVYALVFELSGLLWFYTDTNGTQSFSLYVNRLAEEKADFGPLLRAIDPGFETYEILRSKTSSTIGVIEPPPFACLIESVAAARALAERGENIKRAELVWFYINVHESLQGHTVLAYENQDGAYLVDAAFPGGRIRVGATLPDKPTALAKNFEKLGFAIVKTRQLSIEAPRPTAIVRSQPVGGGGVRGVMTN